MPKDTLNGSKMTIFQNDEKGIKGIYIHNINGLLASSEIPDENLVFLEEYNNIIKKLKNGEVLEIRKTPNKTTASMTTSTRYYSKTEGKEIKVEGKEFFAVLSDLNTKIEKTTNKPKVYQKLINSIFTHKNYL